MCVTFLEQIAKLTSNVALEICAEQSNLSDQVKSEFKLSKKANYLAQIYSANSTFKNDHVSQFGISGWRQRTEHEDLSKMIGQI